MELKTVLTCPLGSKCEEIKDNAIHRCVWFQTFAGTNPNTGEQVDEKGCAMAWLPILMIENSKQQLSTSAAVESFRNEMVKAQETSQKVLLAAAMRQPAPIKYLEEDK
jgi:hypothetical protein